MQELAIPKTPALRRVRRNRTQLIGTPITWQRVSHDTLVAITGVGQVLETTQTDALNHVQKTRSDGAGRTLETVDALSNVTTATFDAAGNQLSLRDPNSIGWNATYDARNRQITMADTQEQAESTNRQTGYDAESNVVSTTDAKGQSTSSAFDARDRRSPKFVLPKASGREGRAPGSSNS